MRAISSTLLCSSLLIHAMLGCCWHDLHDGCAGEASHGALATDGNCDHDRDCAPSQHGSHAPCKGHPNCHGLCHYLPVQKSSVGQCLDHSVVDFAVDGHAIAGSHVSA